MKKYILGLMIVGVLGIMAYARGGGGTVLLHSQAVPSQGSTTPMPFEIVKYDPGFNSIGRPLTQLKKIIAFVPCAAYGSFTIINDNDVTSERVIRYSFVGFDIWTRPEIDRVEHIFGSFNPGANPFDFLQPIISVGQYSHGPQNGYGSATSDLLGPNSFIILEPGEELQNERVQYSFNVFQITDATILRDLTLEFGEPQGSTTTWLWAKTFAYQTFTPVGSEVMPYIPIRFTAGSFFQTISSSDFFTDGFAEPIIINGEYEIL